MQGIIFDIKRYAIHDGPGIRTTVFLKGCPLDCWWCHNPESRSPEIFSYTKKEKINGRIFLQEETVGKKYSVKEVIKEVEKDIVFYEESGGGVTFSGGEPFKQFEFLLSLLKSCRKKEIRTCVDTTGFVNAKQLKEAAAYTDLFLFDLKHFDDKMHIKYTNVSNKQILDNLRMLDEMGKAVEIRYPLIPGMNDDEADLLRMLAFLQTLKNTFPVSILPYHKIGSHKYERFGLEYKMEGVEEPSEEHIENIKNTIKEAGFMVKVGG
jgi:pyruvate formate lyase activating enzyme